jgi:hypothetical protein
LFRLTVRRETPYYNRRRVRTKKGFREQARKQYEEDWLAPFGSEREKEMLRTLLKHRASKEERQLIYEWLRDPDAIKSARNGMFMLIAKKRYLGEVIWATAGERHKQLDDQEWLVAYFTLLGKKQKTIASLTHLSERRVDQIISGIKDKIAIELHGSIQYVGIPQITRWFLGL